jgi:hypothetical protein
MLKHDMVKHKKQTSIAFKLTKSFKKRHKGHSMQKITMKTKWKGRGCAH